MATSLSKLHPYVKEKAEQLLVNANKRLTSHKMIITQAYRSKEEQDKLYAQGRTDKYDSKGKRLSVVTNARGGRSMHNFGLAIDFALITPDGKTAIWDINKDFDKDGKADWMEVVEEAKKLGFEWGGDWKSFKDYPHFQMTAGLTDSQVYNGVKPKFPITTTEGKKETVTNKKPSVSVDVTPKPIVPYPGIVLKEKAKGMKEIDIKRVQRASGMAEKDVDGKYGPKTTKAVKAYQKKQGLAIDGEVGIKTWNRMF
jgi:peptidoglycan L-alanyl-D-glutamate endopeptidase CwlK